MSNNDSDSDVIQQLRNLDREQITQLLDRYEEFEGSEYHRCHFCEATRPCVPYVLYGRPPTVIVHEPTCVGAAMIRILDRL
jgi:hypothetical protein